MNQRIKHAKPTTSSYDAIACGYECDVFVRFKNMHKLIHQNNTESDQYFYHSDHLGSSSWITDNVGDVNQHLQYLPFGESFIDQRTNHDIRFKFTTKEEDSETGYTYFGARYYSSDISVWLSVDPLAVKYPSQSPYSYVGNRPINVIDPNGEDEWEINKRGKVTKHIKTDKHDAFYRVDKNGNRIEGKSATFKYGTITGVNKPKVKVKKNGKVTTKGLTLFNVKGDKNATKLFKFFANNTKVEWTHAKIGSKNSEKNIVGSSHDKSSTPVGHYLRLTKYHLREVNHNHPSGSYFPSDADKNGAKLYKKANPNVKLHIFTSPNRSSEYDEKGTLDFSTWGKPFEVTN